MPKEKPVRLVADMSSYAKLAAQSRRVPVVKQQLSPSQSATKPSPKKG
jgi:hypothetical protein